jgi:pimeloyl-ACP methyl ester carboxylesterase
MAGDGIAVHETAFRSPDGLQLRGTLTVPRDSSGKTAVFVHGGGVTRHEGGFFTRLADGLAQAGMPSLRFDFRAHGESEGRQEDLTISGIVNDIRAAVDHACRETGGTEVNLVAASFGGGISGFYASRFPRQVSRLVLLNPLLNYKKRFIDDKPFWRDDHIEEKAGRELAERGYLLHSPTFKLGRPLLNEVFYLQPHRMLGEILAPTLIVHGTQDTFIPIDSSRAAVAVIAGGAKLIEIDGAQHGLAVPDDPQYLDPQTQEWQASVVRVIAEWLTTGD